jgi:hypothetical protein
MTTPVTGLTRVLSLRTSVWRLNSSSATRRLSIASFSSDSASLLRRDEALLEELFLATVFLERVFDAAFARADRAFKLGALPGKFGRRAFDCGIELDEHLPLFHEIAAIDRQLLDDTFDRAADFDDLSRLHDAIELRGDRPSHQQDTHPGEDDSTQIPDAASWLPNHELHANRRITSTRRNGFRIP